MDATVEKVPCRSTTGGASDRHSGSLTPAIPTVGSAGTTDEELVDVGAVEVEGGVGIGVGVGTAGSPAFVGTGDPEPVKVVGTATVDPVIVGTSITPDSESDDEGAMSVSEMGAAAGAGSAEHPTTGSVIRAAATAAGITSGRRD